MAQVLSFETRDLDQKRSQQILNQLFPPPRTFGVRLWDGSELAAAEKPAFNLVFNHPGAIRLMLTPPIELSLGEAFIHGDFDIEGDIFSAISIIDDISNRTFKPGEVARLAREMFSLPRLPHRQPVGRSPAQLSGVKHSRERDRLAIQYHYDVGNDFYALWLDQRMQYSCAYFATGTEDLDTAQEHKLEHICRKLRLNPNERLLDIGCGWGGLAMLAAEKYQAQVTGVTLSKNQAAYANERIANDRLGERVSIALQDYRDLGSETFDKIVSVGMFEHVGQDHLEEYFRQAYRLLKPGGLFLNHGISQRDSARTHGKAAYEEPQESTWQRFVERRLVGNGSFMQRYVFPDGELVPVSLAATIAEAAGFEVRDVENLREHYALTLRHWVNRLEKRRDEAIAAAGEMAYRVWRLYMSACVHGFESGMLNVNQILLLKPDGGKSNLPLTRADLYI